MTCEICEASGFNPLRILNGETMSLCNQCSDDVGAFDFACLSWVETRMAIAMFPALSVEEATRRFVMAKYERLTKPAAPSA